ncbi:MAG: trimethylamine methyltransferase family protein [Chloroflexota bacterium]
MQKIYEQALLILEKTGIHLEGYEVSDEMLGADAIARVGIGGNYLRDEHTIRHQRSERYFSKLLKPQTRDGWITGGSKDLTTRATERAREILENHQPVPLEENKAKRVQEVIRAAEKEFGQD